MNLEFKQTIKDVFKIKDFHIYTITFAILSTLCGIISDAKNINFKWELYLLSAMFVYIPLGFLMNIIHNKMNDKNKIIGSFFETIFDSFQTGLKAFFAIALNFIIFGFFATVLLVTTSLLAKVPVEASPWALLKNPPVLIVFIIVSIFATLLFNFLPVVYSKNYSVKETLNWIYIFKKFFTNAKETLLALIAYVLACLVLFSLFFACAYGLNLILIPVLKVLVAKGFTYAPLILYFSDVIAPFFISLTHYILLAIIYVLLAKIYIYEQKFDEDLCQLQANNTDNNDNK